MTASKRPAPPTKESAGPAEIAPTRKLLASQNSPTGSPVTPLPLRWAKTLIDGADGPIPEYGSPEFADLPDDSRVRVASCVMAAERWRTRHHRVDFATGRRAREIAEARRTRPGDYPGGRVSWDREAATGE